MPAFSSAGYITNFLDTNTRFSHPHLDASPAKRSQTHSHSARLFLLPFFPSSRAGETCPPPVVDRPFRDTSAGYSLKLPGHAFYRHSSCFAQLQPHTIPSLPGRILAECCISEIDISWTLGPDNHHLVPTCSFKWSRLRCLSPDNYCYSLLPACGCFACNKSHTSTRNPLARCRHHARPNLIYLLRLHSAWGVFADNVSLKYPALSISATQPVLPDRFSPIGLARRVPPRGVTFPVSSLCHSVHPGLRRVPTQPEKAFPNTHGAGRPRFLPCFLLVCGETLLSAAVASRQHFHTNPVGLPAPASAEQKAQAANANLCQAGRQHE